MENHRECIRLYENDDTKVYILKNVWFEIIVYIQSCRPVRDQECREVYEEKCTTETQHSYEVKHIDCHFDTNLLSDHLWI